MYTKSNKKKKEIRGIYMEWMVCLSLLVAVLSFVCSCLMIRRVKRQIQEMTEVLLDIKNGNGNRRVLSEVHEITAPLAYEINEIVVSYEERLLALRALEETNKRLMTSLSHDVRTPLTTLIGYLDAVHRNTVKEKERERYVEIARKKAHELKEYIDLLFDWFKLNSDDFFMKMQQVEATELTRNILIDWIPILEEHKIAYAVDIPEEPCYIQVDLDGYLRVLNNLVQNVIAHSQADQIDIILTREDKAVKILVADNGIGMEKEDVKHIFERLYKCDKGRSQRGSGLGLSIVHQLVQKMGGSITVESVPQRGTTFVLYFPKVEKSSHSNSYNYFHSLIGDSIDQV